MSFEESCSAGRVLGRPLIGKLFAAVSKRVCVATKGNIKPSVGRTIHGKKKIHRKRRSSRFCSNHLSDQVGKRSPLNGGVASSPRLRCTYNTRRWDGIVERGLAKESMIGKAPPGREFLVDAWASPKKVRPSEKDCTRVSDA